jgi:hypothetical protein
LEADDPSGEFPPNGRREREKSQTQAPDIASQDSKIEDARADSSKPSGSEIAEAFERFMAAYPRKDAVARARKAFDKLVESGVDPERLITAAKGYAMLMAAEGRKQQHILLACNWLAERGFEEPLPGQPIIDQDGNLVAIEQPQPAKRRGEMTWEEAGKAAIAMMEGGDDGYLH